MGGKLVAVRSVNREKYGGYQDRMLASTDRSRHHPQTRELAEPGQTHRMSMGTEEEGARSSDCGGKAEDQAGRQPKEGLSRNFWRERRRRGLTGCPCRSRARLDGRCGTGQNLAGGWWSGTF